MVVDGIDLSVFSAAISVAQLQRTRCACVPTEPGVYLVTRPSRASPVFLPKSVGGWFKGKDPTDPPAFLAEHWVTGACILYIGKGGGANGLKQRLAQFMSFGNGKNIGHRGGRLIWNLADHQELLVQWKVTPDESPEDVESIMIGSFRRVYGKRPFANLIGGE